MAGTGGEAERNETMDETCLPSELRSLFLFEALTEEQLQTLCDNGHIAVFEPGVLIREGDPAMRAYASVRDLALI